MQNILPDSLDSYYAMRKTTHCVKHFINIKTRDTNMATKRRKNSFTKFLQDIVDNTPDLVNDVVERAESVEENMHGAVRDVADGE